MKYLLAILLFISSTGLNAQNQRQEKIDSLQKELTKKITDTTKVNLLNSLAWEHLLINNMDTALFLAQEAMHIADRTGFKKGGAQSTNIIGVYHDRNGNYKLALQHYYKVKAIREQLHDELGVAKVHNNIGLIHKEIGNAAEALKNLLHAYTYFEKTDFQLGVATTANSIGIVYSFIRNYDAALSYYKKALATNLQIDNGEGLINNYINIGSVYDAQGDYEKTLEYYNKALKLAEERTDLYNLSLIYLNIGITLEKQQKYTEALENLLQNLHLAEQMGNDQRIEETSRRIGTFYLNRNQAHKAKPWLEKSLRISQKQGSNERLMWNYGALSVMDSMLGNFRDAYDHFYHYSAYKDSIFNDENARKLSSLEMQYEFEKTQDSVRLVNEKEIAVRDASIASVRRQRWFFIGGLFSLAVIGGLLYYQGKQRKKNNNKLRILNVELKQANLIKTRFFSILNHDLRSPVANLIHFLHLQNEDPELLDKETKERLQGKTISGAENLLASMEDLLLWSKGQMENFKPEPKQIRIQQLFDDNKKVFSGYQSIHFAYHNPDNIQVFTDLNYLKTIVRNLTSNAINAFTTTENPTIIWEARQENGRVLLSVTDNGPGADSKKFRALYDDKEVVGIKSGLGLHLIRDLAKAIDCTIEVESTIGKGTTIRLLF